MPEKTSTTTVIVGLILLAILILTGMTYMNCKQADSSNVERLTNVNSDSDNASSMDSESTSADSSADTSSAASSASSATDSSASVSQSNQDIVIRRGKNANTSAVYKNMSYAENDRGGAGDIDRYFMDGAGEVDETAGPNNFGALDAVSNKYAAYVTKKTDEGLLPVEDVAESGWFEDPTPVRIKNSQIINIYRQVGVNTQGSSRKNASLDLRGAPANPKTVVSPFLNSSIDPDVNIKGLCL
jgi:cytoskeletal protein RodZ